jgi:hypothetical protein
MADRGTYVYCLVAADRRPAVRRRFARPPRMGPVRLLEVERRLWLVVADAPSSLYSADMINQKLADLDWVSRAAVAHEAVVEAFGSRGTTLPMKLFTIFASDERAVEQIRKDRSRVDRLLARVAHHAEWGVRVALEAGAANDGAKRTARATPRPAPMSGTRYLSQKKAQRDIAVERAERAAATVQELYDRLSAQATLSRRRPAAELPVEGRPLLLDAAFLVPNRRSARFRAIVWREARRLAPLGYRLSLTGPWPPYTFVKD